MKGKISFPYLPIKHALYSDKVDKLGYIYGDTKTGKGMTYEEYNRKLMETYNNSNNLINSYSNGGHIEYLNKKYGILDNKQMKIDNTKYEYYDITCSIYNMKNNELQPFELVKCRTEGLMFVIIVDIPIKMVEDNVESELRFWLRDSMSINVHHEIPDAKRLEMLPTKDLKIKLDNVEGVLSKCRLINYQEPFRLTILVDKFLK